MDIQGIYSRSESSRSLARNDYVGRHCGIRRGIYCDKDRLIMKVGLRIRPMIDPKPCLLLCSLMAFNTLIHQINLFVSCKVAVNRHIGSIKNLYITIGREHRFASHGYPDSTRRPLGDDINCFHRCHLMTRDEEHFMGNSRQLSNKDPLGLIQLGARRCQFRIWQLLNRLETLCTLRLTDKSRGQYFAAQVP